MQHSYRHNHLIFGLLLVLTIFTWAMGELTISSNLVFYILLITAIIKVQLIGDFFMKLLLVSGFWRWIISLWVLLTGTLITIAFY